MFRNQIIRSLAVLSAVMLLAAATAAAQAVIPVSPGGAEVADKTDTRCPTFSWAVEGSAANVEFVVYRVGAMGLESEPVISLTLPGKASTWTPSVGNCLERGGEYAWSVRALGETASEWSLPSFFNVAGAPSEAEFERALEIVEQYLGSRQPVPADQKAAPAPVAASTALDGTTTGTSPSPGDALVVYDGNMVVVDSTDAKFFYVQLDTMGLTESPPPAEDCDEVNERGRMIYNPAAIVAGGILWLCDDSGWRPQAF